MGREDEIRAIAYRIWEEEGCRDGHDFDYWLKAEVIWEDKQKDVAASIVTKTKPKGTAEQGEKERPAFSQGADSTPDEPRGIHRSLILKVLGQ